MKTSLTILSLLFCAASCTQEPAAAPAAELPSALFAETAPDGALGVTAARSSAKVGTELVLRGMIGGRKAPFGSSSATFALVDPSIEPCPADEGCTTPWDCCCLPNDEIAANSATVQVVDPAGAVLPIGLDGTHGLAPQARVIVTGTVRSVDGGLVVDATRIHVDR